MSLLCTLLESLEESFQGRLIVDERFPLPARIPEGVAVQRISPRIWSRLNNEWDLKKSAGPRDVVLCFGNLPPIFRLHAAVLLLLQNRYQAESRSLRGFPSLSRLRIVAERIWLKWGNRNIDQIIVQIPSMRRAVAKSMGKQAFVLPFFENPRQYSRSATFFDDRKGTNGFFLYVASGEPHKNHRVLLEAWSLLAREGIRPGLCLTLDENRFSELCHWVEGKKREFALELINRGNLATDDLKRLYRESLALIYPSDFESYGLPLIEARCEGLPILASEKDYVRDAIDPEETFDPASPVSIARAVKRFLGIPEKPLPVTNAREWLLKILDIAGQ